MGLAGTSTHGEPQVSPVPSVQCKEPQASQVSQEQSSMENSILENLFWEEAPVHCPFELELAAQVKGAGQVPHRVHQQEGQAQNHLPPRLPPENPSAMCGDRDSQPKMKVT